MKKGPNKHLISNWKIKTIIAILTPFIFIGGVNAAVTKNGMYAPDQIIINETYKDPIYQVVSNLMWWGQYGDSEKWALQYDNLNLDENKRYTISGAIYADTNVHSFSTPIISSNGVFCSIENTYNYNYQIMKDFEYYSGQQGETYEWSNYGTNVSKLISFNCENVIIKGEPFYINILFPETINNLRVTEITIIESSSSTITQQQQETNEKLEEFIESDLSEEDKEAPDDSSYQDYTESEDALKDKMNEADMSAISIGIDANSSSWVWDTLTSLIRSHTAVFGMFIAILSIGIIKLALGR